MEYRPEIDGLRAIAVVPVVLFHAGVPAFDGGYLGVDVFFVISGYLITSIVADQVRDGRFSFARFYERRARRLMPALFAMMAFVWAGATAWSLPLHHRLTGEGLIAVSVYVSNVLFWDRVDYFGPAAELNPLLHTWSLAVEEQFYLIFPALLVAGVRGLGAHVRWAVLAVGLASLALAQVSVEAAPTAGFFLLPFRAWELMAGSALALFPGARAALRHGWLGAVGLVAVAASFVVFDDATPTPSLWTLVPVGGTVLVIAGAQAGTWTARALSWRPLVHVGLISYALYLWHHPLYAFARQTSVGEPSTAWMAALTGLSFLLAEASYRLIERPIRHRQQLTRRHVFAGTVAGSLAFVSAGGIAMSSPHEVDDARVQDALDAAAFPNPRHAECFTPRGPVTDPCRLGDPDAPVTVVLYGDSHADAFAPGLSDRLAAEGTAGVQFTYSGCPPILGIDRPDREARHDCVGFNDTAMSWIRRPEVDRVLVSSRWERALRTDQYTPSNGCRESRRMRRLRVVPHPDVGGKTRQERMAQSLRHLVATGKEIVFVGPIPPHGCDVPETIARLRGGDGGTLTLPREDFDAWTADARGLLANATGPKVHHVHPSDVLCDRHVCYTEWTGEVLYSDDNHLSRAGVDRVWQVIDEVGVFAAP